MACKNCEKELSQNAKYCAACGAEVVQERITVRHLLQDLYTSAFGWDNKFWVTIRYLIMQPGAIFEQYIGGTRKKFTHPFSFFAIGAALSLLAFSQFPAEFTAYNTSFVEAPTDGAEAAPGLDAARLQQSLLQYWNLYSFLLLPLYTLIAWWVFGGPYNFGEHLVINAYIQGITFMLLTLVFLVSLATHPQVFYSGQVCIIVYYSYAYARLYRHSFGRSLLKLLKFIGIVLLVCMLLFAASTLIGLILKKIG